LLGKLNSNKKYLVIGLVLLFVVLTQTEIIAQCAMCKQAAESSLRANPNSLARSLNTGILYLMAVPYIMIAFIFRKQIAQLFRKLKAKAGRN
jgi:hypothetical protein